VTSGQKHGEEKAAVTVMAGCSLLRGWNIPWHLGILVKVSLLRHGKLFHMHGVSQMLCATIGLLGRIFTVVIYIVRHNIYFF
jgi:hypothetical protein